LVRQPIGAENPGLSNQGRPCGLTARLPVIPSQTTSSQDGVMGRRQGTSMAGLGAQESGNPRTWDSQVGSCQAAVESREVGEPTSTAPWPSPTGWPEWARVNPARIERARLERPETKIAAALRTCSPFEPQSNRGGHARRHRSGRDVRSRSGPASARDHIEQRSIPDRR
jgi:hypothetical protein